LVTGELKPLKHKEIPGFLSAAQIAPHHTAYYGGALKAVVAADAKSEESTNSGTATDPAAFAHLKRLINSRGNSVMLHESYFDGLALKPVDSDAKVRAAIEKRFGSIEKWAAHLVASAKESAGWAMLVWHPANGKVNNIVSDEYAMGVLWMAKPIFVIDTYENALYIDYQNRKAEYIEKFMSHIDWRTAKERFENAWGCIRLHEITAMEQSMIRSNDAQRQAMKVVSAQPSDSALDVFKFAGKHLSSCFAKWFPIPFEWQQRHVVGSVEEFSETRLCGNFTFRFIRFQAGKDKLHDDGRRWNWRT
jgi:superoxide dismutase, Fe-Mn family